MLNDLLLKIYFYNKLIVLAFKTKIERNLWYYSIINKKGKDQVEFKFEKIRINKLKKIKFDNKGEIHFNFTSEFIDNQPAKQFNYDSFYNLSSLFEKVQDEK